MCIYLFIFFLLFFQNKLGLENYDEMKKRDMVELLSIVQKKYCPSQVDGRVHPIPLGGDGLSAQNAYNAIRARDDSFNPMDGLAGLIPKPEDWHEGVIVLQVSYSHIIPELHTLQI